MAAERHYISACAQSPARERSFGTAGVCAPRSLVHRQQTYDDSQVNWNVAPGSRVYSVRPIRIVPFTAEMATGPAAARQLRARASSPRRRALLKSWKANKALRYFQMVC